VIASKLEFEPLIRSPTFRSHRLEAVTPRHERRRGSYEGRSTKKAGPVSIVVFSVIAPSDGGNGSKRAAANPGLSARAYVDRRHTINHAVAAQEHDEGAIVSVPPPAGMATAAEATRATESRLLTYPTIPTFAANSCNPS
jgi:hypothetical protein